jgi:hypothetical protein
LRIVELLGAEAPIDLTALHPHATRHHRGQVPVPASDKDPQEETVVEAGALKAGWKGVKPRKVKKPAPPPKPRKPRIIQPTPTVHGAAGPAIKRPR